jgi:hypothetical protein
VCAAAGFFSVFVLEEGKRRNEEEGRKASERKTRYVCCVELSKIIDRSRKPSENSLEKLFLGCAEPSRLLQSFKRWFFPAKNPRKEQQRIQAGTCPLMF